MVEPVLELTSVQAVQARPLGSWSYCIVQGKRKRVCDISPWKRGGSLPMALMLAAAAPAAAGPPSGGPPPPGGPGGFPLVPPLRSPIAILRSSSSSYAVSGCCGAMAMAAVAWVAIWVVVWVVVVIVNICDKSFFATAKNGVGMMGVSGARGSFSMAGLLWMTVSRGSCSGSDSLLCARVGILML